MKKVLCLVLFSLIVLVGAEVLRSVTQAKDGVSVVPSRGYTLLVHDPMWKGDSNTDSSPMWQDLAYELHIPQGASKYIQIKIPTFVRTEGYEYNRYLWDLAIYVTAEGEDIVLEDGIYLNKHWDEYDLCARYALQEYHHAEKTITLPVTHRGKPLTVWVWYSFYSHAKNNPGDCWFLMELQGCSIYGE